MEEEYYLLINITVKVEYKHKHRYKKAFFIVKYEKLPVQESTWKYTYLGINNYNIKKRINQRTITEMFSKYETQNKEIKNNIFILDWNWYHSILTHSQLKYEIRKLFHTWFWPNDSYKIGIRSI